MEFSLDLVGHSTKSGKDKATEERENKMKIAITDPRPLISSPFTFVGEITANFFFNLFFVVAAEVK